MIKALPWIGLTLCLPYMSAAQSITLDDEIVSVGTVIGGMDASELSSPVTVIDAEHIERRGSVFVGEILRQVPGVSVNRSGPGGALTQIRMRGSEANHVLVLIDGVEVSNPVSGEFDFAGLRGTNIEKIEVLRGEQSALYGSDAIGGVINIVTESARTEETFEVDLEGGSFGTFNGNVNAVMGLGQASLSVSGGGFVTRGYDISGTQGDKDGSEQTQIDISLNKFSVGPLKVFAKYGASRLMSEFDEDLDFNGRLDDTLSESEINRETARLDIGLDALGFDSRLRAFMADTSTDTDASFASLSKGQRKGVSLAARRAMGSGSLTVLGEWEEDQYEITPSFAVSPAIPKNQSGGLAASYNLSWDGLNADVSVRHDFNDLFSDATTWRAGGTWSWEDVGGLFRASVGTGVKNPTLIELFGFYPESRFVGNPDLKPESSIGFTLGYEQSALDGDLNLSLHYFSSDLEQEIFTDFSSFPFLARNGALESSRKGVEIDGDWKMTRRIRLSGSATFLESQENAISEIRRPDFVASAGFDWAFGNDANLSVFIDHTGSQMDTDFATFETVKLSAFTLVGVNLTYPINELMALTVRGDNLLDEEYEEVVGYRSQGRGLYAGLRARFR